MTTEEAMMDVVGCWHGDEVCVGSGSSGGVGGKADNESWMVELSEKMREPDLGVINRLRIF